MDISSIVITKLILHLNLPKTQTLNATSSLLYSYLGQFELHPKKLYVQIQN